MVGGWFDFALMYTGSLLGLLNWLYLPLRRFRVTSRKSATFTFDCIVIFSPRSPNIRVNSFLALSAALPLRFSKTADPSSLYRPILPCSNFSFSLCKANRPMSSQISAPSKLPIVTSNIDTPSFFIHGVLLSNSRDFLACILISRSSSRS